jgi:hypothetical protein
MSKDLLHLTVISVLPLMSLAVAGYLWLMLFT